MAERRYDPLSDRWVIVSPERVQRPWQGEQDDLPAPTAPPWSADCHLCPGATRAGGERNPDYRGVYVFDNDFPAFPPAAGPKTGSRSAPPADSTGPRVDAELLRRQAVSGRCRVLCFHHRHDLTLGELEAEQLIDVVGTWRREVDVLSTDHDWVQCFENKGRMMGCSNEHPHGQIWASSHVPSLPAAEDRAQRRYRRAHGSPLLLDYLNHELASQSRVVDATACWVAVVPFWAAWPFETLLLPRRAVPDFAALDDAGMADLARILRRLLGAYDRLFGVPMPYSMGWHGRGRGHGSYWQLHAHFYPPLLRSAQVRKFMVGYEMLAEAQRDLTPEAAAGHLRAAVAAER